MNIQAEKIELAKLLLSTNDPKILTSIKKLFELQETPDIWSTLSSAQQAEINSAIHQMENGQTIDFKDFLAKHKE